MEKEVCHRYSANSFKLHRLPTPKPGQVMGLVGTNGIGKSTALKILAGKLAMNFGNENVYTDPLVYFRGSELQNFFQKRPRSLIKPQYVDAIPAGVGTMKTL